MRAHFQPPRAYFSIIKRARGDIPKLVNSFVLLHYRVGSCGSYRGILDPTISKCFALLHYLVGSCGSYRGILDPKCERTFVLLHQNQGSHGSYHGLPDPTPEDLAASPKRILQLRAPQRIEFKLPLQTRFGHFP